MEHSEKRQGLYCPEMEHDNCGIGFIANLKGFKTHKLVADALTMLENMEHRGGTGCDSHSGDGAGILIQTPHQFFVRECRANGFQLPQFGGYAVGMIFFPTDENRRELCRKILNEGIEQSDLELMGYRAVPVDPTGVGELALSTAPYIEQVFVRLKDNLYAPELLERKVFALRKYTTNLIRKQIPHTEDEFYLSSMSYKTIVYKGQLTTQQLRSYFPDLNDPHVTSAIALVHSRFSTNTFPKWKLAQPFDYIAHNGEINTIRGNVNNMKAKEALMTSPFFSNEELARMSPICDIRRSDSSNLDSIIEILVFGGRSLPHAMMMLIPEAWQEDKDMAPYKRAFYKYHASFMEPWDGPASICFTDGRIVGATVDRNGLRPSRYLVTDDDHVIMASEAGTLPIDDKRIIKKGWIQPGKMFVADIGQGLILTDEELKKEICYQQPYQKWLDDNLLELDGLPTPTSVTEPATSLTLRQQQILNGITSEDIRMIIKPMATDHKEPIGSMGSDTPLAILSQQSRHFSHYFKQLFAQVSNPPIDPIRERLVMSLQTRLGGFSNMLRETPLQCRQINMEHPILDKEQFFKLQHLQSEHFKCTSTRAVFNSKYGMGTMEQALNSLVVDCENAIANGYNMIVISNRTANAQEMPIPSLLATSHVHHALLSKGTRGKVSLIIEAGDAWEAHHFATLLGYGASAIYPYLAYDTVSAISNDHQSLNNYLTGITGGLLKVLSKMGISTMQSYMGAQIFEAIGINSVVINKSFYGTISRIEGLDYDDIAREQLMRYNVAFPKVDMALRLPVGGLYQWKRQGEEHLFNPDTISLLQQATKANDKTIFKAYTESINDQRNRQLTLRGLLRFKAVKSIPIDEVEPVESIFKRFATGAMSFGSISHEAHSTLAIAMNRIGGKSNSGEGGEDAIRYEPKANGDWERSAIKQVASARFGVTSHYLTNADELQIKMAQGAKPGEGGQLPGHKVDEWIARVRHSTPGVGLISPPPHHDIYSIEDLAQLIFDLKNANRHARINVKLVSEAGVGTIAAGVVKAKADVILIAGHDGGTGASPLSSVQHAGLPWELGIAEAHQTLLANKLRSRVTLQVDGQLRTGRDLAIATMLGAEEWGISTAALVVQGCIMMRKCHLNTCPVGIATQNQDLRKLFTGKVEHVVNFFRLLAEDLREVMAELGIKTVNELVGRSDLLEANPEVSHWKIDKLDLRPLISPIFNENLDQTPYKTEHQDHKIELVKDWTLVGALKEYMKSPTSARVYLQLPIVNTDRTIGALVSNEISKHYGVEGLPDGHLHAKFKGSAGQSFGAFSTKGLLLELEGEANDYVGKGLCGAQLVIYPPKKASYIAHQQIIVGNVALYGATSGKVFIRGLAGERFAVRNSGAEAVVEGVGDHACEYMTGGTIAILGSTGRNFGAGMSGGIAYVFDPDEQLQGKIKEDNLLLEKLSRKDKFKLNAMIKEHYELTGSNTARDMLIYWKETLNHMVKVISEEYKMAIEAQEENEVVIRKVV